MRLILTLGLRMPRVRIGDGRIWRKENKHGCHPIEGLPAEVTRTGIRFWFGKRGDTIKFLEAE